MYFAMNQHGHWVTYIGFWGILIGFTMAVVVLGYQISLFLKHGVWVALSVIDGVAHITRPNPPAWLLFPDDWVGVHKLGSGSDQSNLLIQQWK